MQRLSLAEFEADAHAFDASVQASGNIDRFCSSSDWILPAHHAFGPHRQAWIWRDGRGYLAFMGGRSDDGWTYLQPFEAMWCFATPVIGPSSAALTRSFAAAIAEDKTPWDVLMLGGLVAGGPLFRALVEALHPTHRLRLGPVTKRRVADISRGVETYLASRSTNMRRSLSKAQRRAQGAGITFAAIDHLASDVVYERIQDVEQRCWKGISNAGINVGGMRVFYHRMAARLAARGTLRVLLARHEDRDVGYILGGVRDGAYRGLQLSYAQSHADYSLGNLLQLEQLRRLEREGVISYDLGADMPYKTRWAEGGLETVMIVAVRR